MAAPTLSTAQQLNTTLKGQKQNKTKLRNVLTSPYVFSGPVLNKSSQEEVIKTLRKTFTLIDLKRSRTKKRRGKSKTAEKDELPEEKSSPEEPARITNLRTQLALGVNAVSRYLERDELRAVLVDAGTQPPLLTRHVLTTAALRACPVLHVNHLAKTLAPLLDLSSLAALGFKKLGAGDEADFDSVVEFLVQRAEPLNIPWLSAPGPATADTTQAVTDTTQAVTDTTQAVTDTTQAVVDTTQAVTDITQAVPNATQPVTNITQAVTDTTQAVVDTTQAVVDATQAVVDATQLVTNITPTAADTTQAVVHTTQGAPDTQPITAPDAPQAATASTRPEHTDSSTQRPAPSTRRVTPAVKPPVLPPVDLDRIYVKVADSVLTGGKVKQCDFGSAAFLAFGESSDDEDNVVQHKPKLTQKGGKTKGVKRKSGQGDVGYETPRIGKIKSNENRVVTKSKKKKK